MIILISYSSCKSDNSTLDESLSRKDQYFKDYQSPEYMWGFIDPKGSLVIPAKFDDLRDFANGMASASFQGKWGIIDTNGNYLVEPLYLDIHQFNDGLCLVEDFENNKYYINQSGEKVIDCPYDECYSFSDGFVRVVGGDVTSYLNTNGDILEGMNFTGGTDFKNGYAVVKLGARYGIVNTQGEKVLPVKYDRIKLSEGIATCKLNGEYTFFNLKTKSTFKGSYNKASIFEDGYSVVKTGTEYGVVDSYGKYRSLGNGKLRYLNENRWSKKTKNGYSIIDEKGIPISDSTYTNVFKFSCGIAGFARGESWSYVTIDGIELFEPQLPIIWDCSENYIRFISNSGYGYMDHTSSIKIAPKYLEARDFKEGLARVQIYK